MRGGTKNSLTWRRRSLRSNFPCSRYFFFTAVAFQKKLELTGWVPPSVRVSCSSRARTGSIGNRGQFAIPSFSILCLHCCRISEKLELTGWVPPSVRVSCSSRARTGSIGNRGEFAIPSFSILCLHCCRISEKLELTGENSWFKIGVKNEPPGILPFHLFLKVKNPCLFVI